MDMLLEALAAEKDIYAALLGLSREKKEAVISSALDQLNRIVREEQALIARLNGKERVRLVCVRELAGSLGHGNDVTLAELSALADSRQKAVLDELQTALSGLLGELQAANEVNRKLLESRLDYVHFVMDSLTAGGNSTVYGALGEEARKPAQRPNLYDQKV